MSQWEKLNTYGSNIKPKQRYHKLQTEERNHYLKGYKKRMEFFL